MTDSVRRRRVEEVCGAALGREAGERAAFLAAACGPDHAMRQEVETLLAHAERAEVSLSEPAARLGTDPGTSMLTGHRIGVYEVQALLGAGGMGEVYRARDTKLGRYVAIKVLPRIFAADAIGSHDSHARPGCSQR